MIIKQLSIHEISEVYHHHLKCDFPDNERKPLFVIKNLYKRNLYLCYGLFDDSNESLKAYAFLARGEQGTCLLLDYFAAVADARGRGYGSRLLQGLSSELPATAGILAEVEHAADGKDAAERETRQRRIDFYGRNGFVHSHVNGVIFGVHYDIVYLPIQKPADDTFILGELAELYRTMLPQFMFEVNVHLEIHGDSADSPAKVTSDV
ncbi:MAG: N-acetyltransferase [Clostridia bacterium]|nr:N-acetyltransferase [Clostridia bacterium]NCC75897.1 N-acetyltransferase [Clostridia bacterium]